jgi:hypothetical protein
MPKVNTCVSRIRAVLEDKGFLDLDTDTIDIVLDLCDEQSAKAIKCGYYLVDHSRRSVFWMEDFKMSQIPSWKRIPGIDSTSHIGARSTRRILG